MIDLENLLRQQETHWRANRPIDVEQLAQGQLGDDYGTILDSEQWLELICNEVTLREMRGEHPTLYEYQRRFPRLSESLKIQWEIDGLLQHEHGEHARSTHHRSMSIRQTRTDNRTPIKNTTSGLSGQRYVLGPEIGRGAIGIVFEGWDPQLKRQIAIKRMRSGMDTQPEDLIRLRSEAEAIAKVQSEHIVQIYDVGELEGEPYLAMEYCKGGSLASRIGGKPLPPMVAAQIAEGIAKGTGPGCDDLVPSSHCYHRTAIGNVGTEAILTRRFVLLQRVYRRSRTRREVRGIGGGGRKASRIDPEFASISKLWPAFERHQRNYAVAEGCLGIEESVRGDWQRGRKLLVAACDRLKNHVADPSSLACNGSPGWCLNHLGIFLSQDGETDEATSTFKEAIETLKALSHRLVPNKSQEYREIAMRLNERQFTGETFEQRRLEEFCLILCSKISGYIHLGSLEEAVRFACELREKAGTNADALYNGACAYSLIANAFDDGDQRRQKYSECALEILNASSDAGWVDGQHAEIDPDLKPLKDFA